MLGENKIMIDLTVKITELTNLERELIAYYCLVMEPINNCIIKFEKNHVAIDILGDEAINIDLHYIHLLNEELTKILKEEVRKRMIEFDLNLESTNLFKNTKQV